MFLYTDVKPYSLTHSLLDPSTATLNRFGLAAVKSGWRAGPSGRYSVDTQINAN